MTTPGNSNTTTPANAGVSAQPSGNGSNDGAAQPWMHTEAIILWVSWAAMLVFNIFAELGKLGGVTTEEVSNEATTWFMPAGYAFTIWVVIYIALALWVVILSRDEGRERLGPLPITTRGALFVVTCALNIAWLAVWHSRQLLASIILIALLLIAVWTLCAMSRGQEHSLLDWVPLSLYGSWLAVATIANIMHVVSRYFDPKGSNIIVQSISTLALLVLLVAISVFMNARMHDWVCGVVVIWSTVAIGVHLMDTSRFFAVVLIVFATLSAIVIYLPWRRLLPQQQQDQAA